MCQEFHFCWYSWRTSGWGANVTAYDVQSLHTKYCIQERQFWKNFPFIVVSQVLYFLTAGRRSKALYKQQPHTIVVTVYKNGSRDSPVKVAAANMKMVSAPVDSVGCFFFKSLKNESSLIKDLLRQDITTYSISFLVTYNNVTFVNSVIRSMLPNQ